MEVDQALGASLKRQRSPSLEAAEGRATKILKQSNAPEFPSLKRQRSSSEDTLVEGRDNKISKLDEDKSELIEDDEDEELAYDSDTDVEPEFEHPPDTIELDHIKVTNLKLVSIDEHGHEIQLPRSTTLEHGLPTPEPTPPSDTAKKLDYFDQLPLATQNRTKSSQPNSQQGEAAHDSPANFAWVGDLKLFGYIPSQLYIYHHVSDELHPYTEIVKIAKTEQISLGTLVPKLRDSQWDAIRLNNTILGWQNRIGTGRQLYTREKGMYLETDVVFQGALQPVSDLLQNFFHQDKPSLNVTAWIGSKRTYDKVDELESIVLRGSLQHVSVKVLDILEFREIGVELRARQTDEEKTDDPTKEDTDDGVEEKTDDLAEDKMDDLIEEKDDLAEEKTEDLVEEKPKWDFGYGFFGKLHISVPGTVVPLQADYYLSKVSQSWLLVARLGDDEWTDVFGVKGLNLSEVVLQAELSEHEPSKTDLSFAVQATLELRETQLSVRGTYSKDNYSIEAYIGNLTLQQVGEIFHELIGFDLDVFDYDVTFNSMLLLVSNDGLALQGEVTINGHTAAGGRLLLSKDGISVSGLIGDLEFEELHIKEAGFDVFIASKMDTSCARASQFSIRGDVCFCGVELKVGLYTERSAEGDLYWTIYGEVEGEVSTSRMVPELKATFLDISLSRLALIASNHDAPAGSYPGLQYPVVKGFQFCAAIDGIHELEQLLRGSVKGMVLRAMYISGGQFALSIVLPATRTITFSDSVYTGPLEIEVQAGSDIQLLLKAILNVKVDTQPDPLQLSLGLKANKVAASAYAQMLNDWSNPCNLGEQIVIRKCALEFGIVYTTFFTTGTPGVIGLAGELAIGSKLAGVAMKVSQNPSEQLISAEIKDLGVVDLVEFASLVADTSFPKPDDFIHFNDVQLYLSTGTTVGVTRYPPGASMKGDLTLFGKRAQFDCTVGSKVKIMATMEAFEVGPLKVKGATRADPIVDIELSEDKQHVLIDGAVEIWGASAALHLEAAMYPKTMFDFSVELRLSDLFLLQLQAKLKGDINIKDIKSWANADFEVYALVEQHLIDHIAGQLEQQINAAQEAAKHGFDDIKNAMEAKEAAFKASCQVAIDDLEKKRVDWHQKKAEIDGHMDRARQEASRIRQELQDKVDQAQRSFNSFITEREADLERIRADAAASIRSAEHDIDEAQRDSDEAIREAQAELHQVRRDFENGFGSAERDLESARGDVEDAQRKVDSLDDDIRWIDQRIDDEPWYKCPPLIAEKAGLVAAQDVATASLQVVRGIFYAAEGIVHGTGFLAAEGAIGAAELALEGVRIAKSEALDLTKSALEEINDAQGALIQEAIDALHAAKTASEELHVFDLAKDALNAGESVANGLIDGAQGAVDSLSSCGEFIAFDAAEAALRFAQENTKELNLARHAVEVAEGAVNLGLDIGKWAVQHAGQIFNIRKMEFSGSIRSLADADESTTPPLVVNIEGTVFGEDFEVHIVWKPGFSLVEFIKELFSLLWEKIKALAKDLLP